MYELETIESLHDFNEELEKRAQNGWIPYSNLVVTIYEDERGNKEWYYSQIFYKPPK